MNTSQVKKQVDVKIVSAVVGPDGVASPGEILTLPKKAAAGLVSRGKAEYYTGEKDIRSLKKPELVELATAKGIETKGLNVTDLIDAIETAESDGE